jgi:nucleotide-binding universal stress UspA family protein
MRMLLATDGSEFSEAAAHEVARLGLPPDTEVCVVSVAEVPHQPAATGPYPVPLNLSELEAAVRERARTAVERTRDILQGGTRGDQLRIITKVLSGSPKQALLEEAEGFDPDLIVVGACGHGRFERLLIGSVAQTVAMHAKCSVQITRRRE